MICPTCNGKGRTVKEGEFCNQKITEIHVCPDCDGSGVGYCCEGSGEEIEVIFEADERLLAALEAIPSDVNPNEG